MTGPTDNGKQQVVAVVIHYGDAERTVKAALNHWQLGVFSSVVVVANDLSPMTARAAELPLYLVGSAA